VRYSFLRQALDGPEGAERLSNRVGFLAHAAVGLDDGRRSRVLKSLILPKLRNPAVDLRVRLACVDLGVALEVRDREFARLVVATTDEAIKQVGNPDRLEMLAKALGWVAKDLGSPQAFSAFRQVMAASAKVPRSPASPLADALANVAAGLDAGDARK